MAILSPAKLRDYVRQLQEVGVEVGCVEITADGTMRILQGKNHIPQIKKESIEDFFENANHEG